MKKKYLALVLAACMTASLAACGSTAADTSAPAATTEEAADTAAAESTEAADTAAGQKIFSTVRTMNIRKVCCVPFRMWTESAKSLSRFREHRSTS